jgi:hypothetical protein
MNVFSTSPLQAAFFSWTLGRIYADYWLLTEQDWEIYKAEMLIRIPAMGIPLTHVDHGGRLYFVIMGDTALYGVN